jgi:predicted naringenin-chalcone synthase
MTLKTDHATLSAHQRKEYALGETRPVRVASAPPRIASLAVLKNPARAASQQEALDRLGLAEDEFAQGIFSRSGISRRELNLDDDFLASSLRGRTARVEQDLLEQSVRAIDLLGIHPDLVGTVLTSSLYSLGCPSLAHRLIEHYGLDTATDKYHVTAVGCASAVPLLRLGSQILQANPARDVLVVAAESMSSILVPSRDGDPRVKTVGSAIFGDGCAAALLSARRQATGPAVLATAAHQIPGTLDAVVLTFDEQDSHLALARQLPSIAAEALPGLVEDFLAANQVRKEQIAHWMLHPGGRRIVEEARDALDLTDEDVAVSWQALADHGNIGTPSIFYVLDSTLRDRCPDTGELGLAVTIGPGVTVGLMLIGF